MLLKPKYGRFRNDSVTSSDDLMQSLAMSSKVVATPVVPSGSPSLPLPPLGRNPGPPAAPALADSPGVDGDQDGTTTFCMLIPKMPQWKFSNSLLSRSPSGSSSSKDSSKGPPQGSAGASGAPLSGPVASLAAVLNSCDPVCVAPCSLQAVARQRAAAGSSSPPAPRVSGAEALESSTGTGMNRRGRVDGIRVGGEDFTQKGSFIHKPSQGWLHPDKKITGPGASYIVRYMGCIEVLKSMRSLDFNTRTQVTREAINKLYEAVPGVKGAWKKKANGKALQCIMGKCNLRFAGMSVAVNICVEGLSLLVPTTHQVIAHHPMQSISFASGGDTDTPDYVAYVAKDPVNQRACHILECCDGLAQSVISTIGQAFELQFKQYLHSPPKAISALDRNIRTGESAWGDDEEASEHDYYNSIPGKEPPVGGLVDSRLRPAGAFLGHIHSQPPSKAAQSGSSSRRDTAHPPGQLCYEVHWDTEINSGSGLTSDGYLRADGHGPGSRDYEEHLYVNTQSLEALEAMAERGRSACCPESPKKDIFDMRPFEDALKLHEASGAPVLEEQWPSPPRRRAPIAPTEEQLCREPWYHGRMSRRDAEKLLARDGDFLVRDSATNPGQYVLTGMHCGLPKHLLLVDPEGVVRTKDMLFESINHLINYHLKNKLPIVAAESELHLQQVVCRKQ
ncbi:SHC-transforming protein 2 isoform X1 [Paramormyrops kingsleyae]|uniref:SHC (Src homology 2 domain containing) transforming protein 2 n=2 Tax=Paramormyrops kingsleyae TaxID=1676925 RepID=A0A3B3TDE7_9TELE|nr:SHC-transforming protein 2 isoform X1 [Paramormyrops kingsleyae]XP_023699327.1 SHC-transforming protein 2 isoform X1 [Paramormyrops kingsleyae]